MNKMTQHWSSSLQMLVFALLIGFVRFSAPSDNITVLRCCVVGESIDPVYSETECIANVDAAWPPFIFSPQTRSFRDSGIPENWRVVSGKPKCDYSAVISERGTTPTFLMFDNGSLWVQDVKELLDPQRYCVEEKVALVCLENNELEQSERYVGDKKKRKIKKCCGEGGAYSEKSAACITSNATTDFKRLTKTLANNKTILTTGFPSCPKLKSGHHSGFVIAGGFDEKEASIDEHGVLRFKQSDVAIQPYAYCLEHVSEHSVVRANIFTCPSIEADETQMKSRHQVDWRFTLYPVGLMLSVFFLAATLAVGCVLPSSHQHMLHWRCQTGHVACLLIGDLVLAITQFTGDRIGGITCQIMASAMHFFFLAAFFWLNTMCFNIWWTFRDMRPASLDKSQETFRLRLYQLYAWGGPAVISGIAALIDNIPGDNAMSLMRPRFGEQRCWFYGDKEILTYFYGPLGILLGINLILFMLTARELTCGLWKRDVPKSAVDRNALSKVCLKLVVVMGLTWVADIISWAIGGPHILWYLTDLINALQGVFIFIVVGCQPQIWAAINRLWCWPVNRMVETNIGNNMSSCSQGLPSIGDSVINANSPHTKCVPTETVC